MVLNSLFIFCVISDGTNLSNTSAFMFLVPWQCASWWVWIWGRLCSGTSRHAPGTHFNNCWLAWPLQKFYGFIICTLLKNIIFMGVFFINPITFLNISITYLRIFGLGFFTSSWCIFFFFGFYKNSVSQYFSNLKILTNELTWDVL